VLIKNNDEVLMAMRLNVGIQMSLSLHLELGPMTFFISNISSNVTCSTPPSIVRSENYKQMLDYQRYLLL